MTTLLKLVERLEAATGPDRCLDSFIAAALFESGTPITGAPIPPAYTASLDAAITLVPKGLGFVVHRREMDAFAEIRLSDSWGMPESVSEAPTPALALTAAALRARANQSSTQSEDGE